MGRRAHEDEVEDEDEVAVDQDAEWVQAQLQKTPWWMISVAFHAAILLCLGAITFSREVLFDESPITVSVAGRERPQIADVERPRGIFDTPGELQAPQPTDEPRIEFDEAEVSDHLESDNDEDTNTIKGETLEALAYTPGRDPGKGRQLGNQPGQSAITGLGGGGGTGGQYGHRTGGRRNLRLPYGPTQGSESAVRAGLIWLARHQSSDGSWGRFDAQCSGGGRCAGVGSAEHETGISGLAVLAFLGCGYTPASRERFMDPLTKRMIHVGQVVRKGVDHLIAVQDREGCFGPRVGHYMYDHAIAALALAEAYGLAKAPSWKGPAQRGIDFLVAAQNPGLAWRYQFKAGNNDTSVTGWCVMALKSAHLSGLDVPRNAFQGASNWLDRVTDQGGQVGYDQLGAVDVYVPGVNDQWPSHPSMTAVGLLLRIYIDQNEKDPRLGKAARILIGDKPSWDEANFQVDSYYWYYATLALWQYRSGGGATIWDQWNEAMKNALIPSQKTRKHGCEDGSWNPAVDRWGKEGGRVYMTAVNVMSLEIYYRYASVFGKDGEAKPR